MAPPPSFLQAAIAEPLSAPWVEGVSTLALLLPWVVASAAFATLRHALLYSQSARVLARIEPPGRRARYEPLLARADALATSAWILETVADVAFVAGLLVLFADGRTIALADVVWTVVVGVPALIVLTDTLPTAVALRRGDAILIRCLPAFHLLQMPIRWLVRALDAVRAALLRVVGLRRDPASSRAIVEGLREVIHEAQISGELDETEKEIIGNVMEFRDVSVSSLMTPRTEIEGVDLSEGLAAAARRAAECGHSRIPIHDGSLDRIVGVITARDIVQLAAEGRLEKSALSSILRPAYFVPETKRVSELLAEFKREKIKMAVVLDEYGGTAGLVTLGDIISEIVGDIQDEYDLEQRPPIRRLSDGSAEIDATMRISELNEELDLALPEEEDYETLAGFVLSELGHFPARGERFTSAGVEFTVVDASDRRVFKVRLRRAAENAVA